MTRRGRSPASAGDAREKRERRLSVLSQFGVSEPKAGAFDMRLSQLMPWWKEVYGDEKITEDEKQTPRYKDMAAQALFLQGLVYYYTYSAAALHAGISIWQAKRWLENDPEFQRWAEQARDVAIDIVETGLFGSAQGGKTDSYVFLQANRNDKYRYKGDNAGSGAEVKVVIVNQLPDGTVIPTQGNRIIDAPRVVEALPSGD